MQGNEGIPVSVYIITLNEADKLPGLLNQLKPFQEVIVVDCGSTDATPHIARRFPNVRFYHNDWPGYGAQKSYALSLCSCEWALNIDADEELTPAYFDAIAEALLDDGCVALESPRVEYRWGCPPSPLAKTQRLIRLFRKDCGYYKPRRVHERITVEGRVRRSTAPIIHHQNLTQHQMVEKLNRYSELKALDKFDSGCRANLLILLLIFPWTFLQHYLFKRYLFNGFGGLTNSINLAHYNYNKYAKLWELQHAYKSAAELDTRTVEDSPGYSLDIGVKK